MPTTPTLSMQVVAQANAAVDRIVTELGPVSEGDEEQQDEMEVGVGAGVERAKAALLHHMAPVHHSVLLTHGMRCSPCLQMQEHVAAIGQRAVTSGRAMPAAAPAPQTKAVRAKVNRAATKAAAVPQRRSPRARAPTAGAHI